MSNQGTYQAGYQAGYQAALLVNSQAQPSHLKTQAPYQPPVSYPPQEPQIKPRPQLPLRPANSTPKTRNNPLQPYSAQPYPPPPPPRPLLAPQPPQIWQPTPGTTWNYILSHPLNLSPSPPLLPLSSAEVYILDLFDTPTPTITALHVQDRKVVAYFSAGSYENWRPDARSLDDKINANKKTLGKPMDGWAGERWLDVRSEAVRDVMRRRLDLARDKGFDAVDPDNVDGYDNKNGLGLSRADAVDYVLWLAREAHARGLACGLKNAGDIVPQVLGHVEFAVQEQALQFDDVDAFMPFVRTGKAVFHVEYPKGENAESKKMNTLVRVEGREREAALRLRGEGWSSIVKNVKLDQWVQMD
ncbi:uncharacterized protein HMPREF1541_05360 [Cyphellophora europaea CBS 101466]|uniref:alpha-galactosidase n=1 Tax=Cyphellophora europaea (strain CBS 101466) TaxID=1220924 RepID=W2RRP4_CYPE1|nr:uncharacterized protein HMPREF1541_05360 [Cyphellophora europaea CBS 101466]ETN39137.1 hypothetical protein HMPREF1541_05360 [Cyphellophora europaea CBS 101466]